MAKNIYAEMDDLHNKVLNPNQRQIIEDSRRLKEKMAQLNKGEINISGLLLQKLCSIDILLLLDNNGDPSNLYIRNAAAEVNVDLLDKYDSFYYTTKSLLVLFQIMGIMPIMRSPPNSNLPRTTFQWCSKTFMWAYFIYFCETIIVALGKVFLELFK